MLYGFLVMVYVFVCFLLMALILVQKSKGSLGIGNIGGSMQMLFGGGGGQSLLQKMTWFLGALFMTLSLLLALMKSSQQTSSRYISSRQAPIEQSSQMPSVPQGPLAPLDEMPSAPEAE